MIFKGSFQAKPFHNAVTKPSHLLTNLLSEINRLVYRQICKWNNTPYLLIDLLMNQESWNETDQWNPLMTMQGNKQHNGTYKQIIYLQNYSNFKLVILYIKHTTEGLFSIQHTHESNFLKELLINKKWILTFWRSAESHKLTYLLVFFITEYYYISVLILPKSFSKRDLNK